jgi:2'-5' RNA ligase
MRLFTAVPLNFNVQDALSKVLANIQTPKGAVKWVEPSQAHLTLRFLDEQEENRLPAIVQSLRDAVKDVASFEVRLGGIGAFPNLKRPRVLFVPVIEGAEKMALLNGHITEALGPLGIPAGEKEFHAHVTLGRVKTFKDAGEVVQAAQTACPELLGKIIADHFSLFRSELTPKGPVYTELEKFRFES